MAWLKSPSVRGQFDLKSRQVSSPSSIIKSRAFLSTSTHKNAALASMPQKSHRSHATTRLFLLCINSLLIQDKHNLEMHLRSTMSQILLFAVFLAVAFSSSVSSARRLDSPEMSTGPSGSTGSPTGDTGSGHGPNWDYSWGWGSSPGSGWGYGSGSGHSPTGFGKGFGYGFGSGTGSGSGSGYGWGGGGARDGGYGFGTGSGRSGGAGAGGGSGNSGGSGGLSPSYSRDRDHRG
ncbi:putative glycine-rich cell wall structural protein 1 [Syzygium oleosum]|uniref:putative glycine-rich cell wall structural protein 1 n=1 Tax=Syzygium oleosum TaxID=219896 RepID=UPI0011D25CB0|nr:putative glycine-rich cell wall structural protein 1 [Syzygium oleosum]